MRNNIKEQGAHEITCANDYIPELMMEISRLPKSKSSEQIKIGHGREATRQVIA